MKRFEEFNGNVEFIRNYFQKHLRASVGRNDENNVIIDYSIFELSGVNQNIEIEFLLFDSDNNRVATLIDNRNVPADSEQSFSISFPLDSSLSGNFNLLVNINSETYSSFLQ